LMSASRKLLSGVDFQTFQRSTDALRASLALVQAESGYLGARAGIEAEYALGNHLGSARLFIGGCLFDCRCEASPHGGNRRTVFSRAKAFFKKMAGRPQTVAGFRVASGYAAARAARLNARMLDAQRAITIERLRDRNVVSIRLVGSGTLARWNSIGMAQ